MLVATSTQHANSWLYAACNFLFYKQHASSNLRSMLVVVAHYMQHAIVLYVAHSTQHV